MVKRTHDALFVKMSAGLVLIGIVGALKIDNQLTVIKNDCFERLAIGQRLHGRDIYNTLELNTVPDCQRECTKDEEKCRSFSFGIGVKGNASCELSSKVVKETVDLKPVGTLPDADFDLYIKKLGCKLVIEQKPHFAIPKPETHYAESGSEKPTQAAHESYVQIQYTSPDPAHPHEAVFRPDNIRKPSPSDFNKAQHVQTTLISIRPDPKRPSYTGLGPALGYFDSRSKGDKGHFHNGPVGYEFDGKPVRPYDDTRPNSNFNNGPKLRPYKPDFIYEKHYYDRRPAFYDRYDKYRPYDHPSYFEDNRPPFRPPHLNYPYNDKPYFRPGPGEYDPGPYRPRPDFDRYANELPRPDLRNPDNRPDRDRPRPVERPDPPTTEGDKLHLSLDRLEPTRPRPNYDKSEPNSYHNTHRPDKDFYYEPSKPIYDQRPNDHAYDESSNKPEHQLNRPVYDMNKPMDRPDFNRPESNYNRPMDNQNPNYRPPPDFLDRPMPHFDRPEYIRPFIERPDFNPMRPRPPFMFDYNMDKPKPPFDEEINGPMPDYYYDRPRPFERPMRYGERPSYNDRPLDRPHPLYERPDTPLYNLEKPFLNSKPNNSDENFQRPIDPNNPNVQPSNNEKPEESSYDINRRVGTTDGYKNNKFHNGTNPNQISDSPKPQEPHDKSKPIITQSIGPHGETITSIITEIKSNWRTSMQAKLKRLVSRFLVHREANWPIMVLDLFLVLWLCFIVSSAILSIRVKCDYDTQNL